MVNFHNRTYLLQPAVFETGRKLGYYLRHETDLESSSMIGHFKIHFCYASFKTIVYSSKSWAVRVL